MEIKGIRGYFNDMRIDKDTIPEEFHFWELADGDSDGIPCRYKPGILVNFYGTFITAGELPVDCPECMEGFINSDIEWGFTGYGDLSLKEVIEIEKGNRNERKGGRDEDTEIRHCP